MPRFPSTRATRNANWFSLGVQPPFATSISSTSLNTAIRSAASSHVISNGRRPPPPKCVRSQKLPEQPPPPPAPAPPQPRRPPDPRQVRLQADDDHVPHVRRDLHPPRHEQPAALPELLDLARLPHAVVLGDVDATEADPLRLLDELVGGQRRISGAAHRVHVHIDDGAWHQVRATFPLT